MSTVVIVSPGFPERGGGVTSHTARLQRHWTAAGHEVLVEGGTADPPVRLAAGWRSRRVAAVLLQYVPFLYARRGLSGFPRRVARAARAEGIRVAVFVHEPWVPPTRLPWLVLSPLQRRQLQRLLAVCDSAFTPVPAWLPMLDARTEVIWVGSTLGEPPAELPTEPALPAPVVFSPFAAGLAWDWILAAAQAIAAEPRLTIIGTDWQTARHHPALRRLADPGWDWRGHLDSGNALRLLARARLVLAPFIDGLTSRRTSALAAASVGARLVSSRGPLFDARFSGGPVAIASSRPDFAELATELWRSLDSPESRRHRLEWYRAELDPEVWDRRLLERLLGPA